MCRAAATWAEKRPTSTACRGRPPICGGLYTRLQSAAQDEGFLTQLLLALSSYLTTDCTANQLNDLYRTVSQDQLEVLDPPAGETAVGDEGYMEFHVDEAALRQTVIDLFYEPRQAS